MHILDETSQVIAYSHELEQKSRELEAITTELRAANERLQELDRLKDDFVSTVTHELRTPLTSIRSFSEILYDNPDLEIAQRNRFLNIIIKESERLTRLIHQVLDLAKIESGNAEWHISKVDLRAIIEESVAATSRLFEQQHIRLDLHMPHAVPPVAADPDRLMQVMLNLLSNATKFCDSSHGLVDVCLREQSDALRVDVRDNGPGIAPANQRIIFDKFRQVGDTLTEKPQGTGLGLPISRQIITRLGGNLWLESTPGHGATFSFTLPLAADLPATEQQRSTTTDAKRL
jgi:signal transduction histidine kinase